MSTASDARFRDRISRKYAKARKEPASSLLRASVLQSLCAALAALAVASCGTISRTDDSVIGFSSGAAVPTRDAGIPAGDDARLSALSEQLNTRLSSPDRPHAILALSGGGANGAFGAGVLVGWSAAGDRPEFDVVTGVSTGALSAPFAFLGEAWDDELAAAYTGGQTREMLSLRQLMAFSSPSLFSASTLEALVRASVTPELLAQIAVEHARGRRLLVATTNLDAEETVIWDMGLLASQGSPEALELFRRVLIASASIPGIFPPTMIAGQDDRGRVVAEMHVDGSVNTPFLAMPEVLLRHQGEARGGAALNLYILVNGRIRPHPQTTGGDLPAILARTFDSMNKASLRTSLIATAGFALRSQVALRVAAIPGDVAASSLDFAPESMADLFELGRARGAGGSAWTPLDQALARDESLKPASIASPSAEPEARS